MISAGSNFTALVTTNLWAETKDDNGLMLRGICKGTPPVIANVFQHGCTLIQVDGSTGTKSTYENVGSIAVPSWNLIGDVTAGEITLADGKFLIGGATGVAAAQTLSGDVTSTNAGVTAIGAKKVTAGMTAIADGKILIGGSGGAGAEQTISGDASITDTGVLSLTEGKPFVATNTLTSAAAATPVVILADAKVPAGKKVYITGFTAQVNGGTLWATTATVTIEDTNGTPVVFSTIGVAALGAAATIFPSTANVTNGNAFLLGTGGTAAKGIQMVGDANGTGSDLVVTIYGFIK